MRISRKLSVALMLVMLFASTLPSAIQAQKSLIFLGADVHRNVVRGTGGGAGIDVLARFEEEFGVKVQHPAVPDVHEMLYRLGPLNRTNEDVIHIVAINAVPRVAQFLTPLDEYLETKPIDGWPEDWPEGMINNFKIDGKQYAVPVRAGTFCLWYNQKVFEERGIEGPPKTPEELYEIAKKTTYTREDGTKVYGWVMRGDPWAIHEMLTIMARMWDGDLITSSHEVTVNEPPVVKAVEMLQRMYAEGILPPNWGTLSSADTMLMFQQGRTAMGAEANNYGPILNNPSQSLISGYAVPAHLPLAEELWTEERDYSVSFIWIWAQGILSGSQNKDLAWELIRFLASPQSRLDMAANGNAPARISVTAAQQEYDIGAKIASEIMKYSRPALPPLERSNEICDIIAEHVHNAVINGRNAQEEMDKAAERIKELL